MPIPNAMAEAAMMAFPGGDWDATRALTKDALYKAIAWLRSDAPEAVEIQERMSDAYQEAWDRAPVDAEVGFNAKDRAALLAALAVLAGSGETT